MNIRWFDESDNPLILAAFADDKCCHSAHVGSYGWGEGCEEPKEGALSYRAVDPERPHEGKEGQKYEC